MDSKRSIESPELNVTQSDEITTRNRKFPGGCSLSRSPQLQQTDSQTQSRRSRVQQSHPHNRGRRTDSSWDLVGKAVATVLQPTKNRPRDASRATTYERRVACHERRRRRCVPKKFDSDAEFYSRDLPGDRAFVLLRPSTRQSRSRCSPQLADHPAQSPCTPCLRSEGPRWRNTTSRRHAG